MPTENPKNRQPTVERETADADAATAPAPAAAEPTAEPDDGRRAYTVTERAGPRVAGNFVDETRTVRLTEGEALAELLDGTVVRAGEKLHPLFTTTAAPKAN